MSDSTSSAPPRGGELVRREFGATSVEKRAETAVTAAAAQARSQVEAMYVMALQRPRDMMAVRDRLLGECRRKGFADSAVYRLPRGGKTIEGPSIRFAEAGLRALGNVHVRTTITYEDDERRVGEVTVIDLESNLPLSAGFTIDKTVERRSVKGGDVVLSERVNSSGEKVYRIVANEADVLMKQESLVARLRRNLILQLLPGDIRDEALEECSRTQGDGDGADPKATAKKISDGFASLGIGVAQIREYLGHNLDQVTPDEAKELRGVYLAIKDGQTTWQEVMEERKGGGGGGAPKPGAEEKAEREKLLKTIAAFRVADAAAYESVRKAAGVSSGIADASLPTETLKKIAYGPGKPVAATTSATTAPASEDEARRVVDEFFGGAAPQQ